MGSSDSESEDERRVVRSAKDKAQDELRATCTDIKVGGWQLWGWQLWGLQLCACCWEVGQRAGLGCLVPMAGAASGLGLLWPCFPSGLCHL